MQCWQVSCNSTNKPIGIKIGSYNMDNSECEKLLVLKIDAQN